MPLPQPFPQIPPTGFQQNPGVGPPFYGLYFDRPPQAIPPSGFSACNNVRIHANQVTSVQMGWNNAAVYSSATGNTQVTNPICGGGLFTLSFTGFQYLVIANKTDILIYNAVGAPTGYNGAGLGSQKVFITPVYTTGTVSCDGAGNLTGVGTHWATPIGTGFRNNMRPGDFISFGSTTQNNPFATWFKIATVTSDTAATLTTAGTVQAGVTYTLRQCTSSDTMGNRISFETFPNAGAPDNMDLCFLANGGGTLGPPSGTPPVSLDPIIVWNPTNLFATYLSTYAFTCFKLRRFNNLMVYGALVPAGATNLTMIQSTEIASSDNGLPKSLNTGVAFQGVVSDGAEPIVHMGILGNQLLLYCGSATSGLFGANTRATASGSIVSASFVGLPTVWQFATVIRQRGPISGDLVAEFADRHQFIGVDGEYRYNGLFLQSMNDHVWRFILDAGNLYIPNLSQAFHIHAPSQGDIIWVIPQQNGPGNNNFLVGFVEHYMEQANSYLFKPYTQRDVIDNPTITGGLGLVHNNWTCNLGANPSQTVFNDILSTPLVGDNMGNVIRPYNADSQPSGSNQAAAAFASSATFADRIVAGERARGLIKRVYPFFNPNFLSPGTYNLVVTLIMKDRVQGNVIITDVKNFPITTLATDTTDANRFTTHYRRGRVAQITFSTPGAATGQAWILTGYDWDIPSGSPGGQR